MRHDLIAAKRVLPLIVFDISDNRIQQVVKAVKIVFCRDFVF